MRLSHPFQAASFDATTGDRIPSDFARHVMATALRRQARALSVTAARTTAQLSRSTADPIDDLSADEIAALVQVQRRAVAARDAEIVELTAPKSVVEAMNRLHAKDPKLKGFALRSAALKRWPELRSQCSGIL